MDVIQEVEYVKEEAKLEYLLECLQKTAPPVLVFAENKRDVDAIHEYLLANVSARVVNHMHAGGGVWWRVRGHACYQQWGDAMPTQQVRMPGTTACAAACG